MESCRSNRNVFSYIFIFLFTSSKLFRTGTCQKSQKLSGVIQLSALDYFDDTLTTTNHPHKIIIQEENTKYEFSHLPNHLENTHEDAVTSIVNYQSLENIDDEDKLNYNMKEDLEYRRQEYRTNYLGRLMTKRSGKSGKSGKSGILDRFKIDKSDMMEAPKRIWNSTYPVVLEELKQFPPFLLERLQELWDYIYSNVIAKYKKLTDEVYPEFKTSLKQFKVLWKRIQSEIPIIKDVGRKLIQTIRDDIAANREAILEFFWDTVSYIRELLTDVYNTVSKLLRRIYSDVKYSFSFQKKQGLINKMNNDAFIFVRGLLREFRDTVKKFYRIAEDIAMIPINRLQMLWNRIAAFAYSIWESIKGRGPSLLARIDEWYEKVKGEISKRISRVTQFLKRYVPRAWRLLSTWIRNKMTKISNRILRFYRYVVRKLLGAYTKIRNKNRKLWTSIQSLYRASGLTITYFKDKISTFRYRLRCKIRTYYKTFRTNMFYLFGRASYRLRNLLPNLYKFISEVLRNIYRRWLKFVRLFGPVLNEATDVKKRFKIFISKIVRDIYIEFSNQFRFYRAMLIDIFNQLKHLIRYLLNYFTIKINDLNNLISFKISLIRYIWNYIHDFVLILAKSLYQIARFIVNFLKKKFKLKWLYVFQGIYYFLYFVESFFTFLKNVIHFPIDMVEWLTNNINWFRAWVRENIFRRPGLFYFVGDIIRAIRDRSSIFGWLRRKLERNGLVNWLIKQYHTNIIARTLTNLLVDNFIKDWINWHLFRPTEAWTSHHIIPDRRPHFSLKTILNSIRLRGDPDVIPRTPIDDNMAKAIGGYLNHLFGGSSSPRNPICKLPSVEKIVELDTKLLNL